VIPYPEANQLGGLHVDRGSAQAACAAQRALSERSDGCGMGSDRAFDPASAAGRQAARDGYARGDERGALRFAHGLPMAAIAEGFPPRSTVYSYFWEWSRYGVLDRIRHTLLVACREAEGREASPTAAIIDAQAVKATEKGAAAGIPLATTRAKRSRASSATRLSIR
jgi:transposase